MITGYILTFYWLCLEIAFWDLLIMTAVASLTYVVIRFVYRGAVSYTTHARRPDHSFRGDAHIIYDYLLTQSRRPIVHVMIILFFVAVYQLVWIHFLYTCVIRFLTQKIRIYFS